MKKLYIIYTLIMAEGLSLIGSRMLSIAISIWLYETKGSVTYLLLIPLFNEIPPILFGNLSGTLVDRWNRKYLMIFGDTGQAIGSFLLWLIVFTNNFELWHLYVIVAIQGTFSMFQSLAADASTTLLAPIEHRDRVNALKEMTFPVAGVAAPVLSGFLYSLTGLQGVIIFDLITFVISVVVLLAVKIPNPPKSDISLEQDNTFLEGLIGGFKYLSKQKGLLQLIIYFSFINFMLNGPLELVIPYIMKITGDDLMVPIVLGAMNIGALIGALILILRGDIGNKARYLIFGMIINGIMFLLFGIARTPLLLSASLLVLMIPLPFSGALFKSILQAKTAPDYQGRVFAVVSQLNNIGSTISFLITGPIIDKILEPAANSSRWGLFIDVFGTKGGAGIGILLSVTGGVIVIATLLVYMLPKIRELGK